MPDLWCDVDAALTSVPVNILPLIDDTDFKTIETAVAYNAAGMALYWNFETTAGVKTTTAVTPTTSGTYDWSHQNGGMYVIEIPASGGASINNDTEGVGWFSGVCTGVLPWRGPTIGFRASGLNDALIDSAYSATRGLAGTALPAVAAGASGGVPVIGTGSNNFKSDSSANVTVPDTQKVDVNTIKTNPVVNGGTITFPTNATVASTTNITAGTITTVSGNVNGNVGGNVTGSVGSVAAGGIAAASFAANAVNAAALAADAANEIADALLDRADAVETGLTPRQEMRLTAAASAGKLSGAATTSVVIRNAVADSKDRITATVDASGNRTAVTTDVT